MNALQEFQTLEEICFSQNVPLPDTVEGRLELREAWINRNQPWANFKLHKKFGFQCDSDNCGFCRNNK